MVGQLIFDPESELGPPALVPYFHRHDEWRLGEHCSIRSVAQYQVTKSTPRPDEVDQPGRRHRHTEKSQQIYSFVQSGSKQDGSED